LRLEVIMLIWAEALNVSAAIQAAAAKPSTAHLFN
jgi:hypothetical protein